MWRKRLVSVGLLGGLLWGACRSAPVDLAGDTDTAATAAVSVSGFIEAEAVSVAPEVTGLVVTVTVAEGDRVAAGQRLLQLDDALTRAQLTQVQAAWLAAQTELTRTLAGPRPESVAAAQADLARAQASWLGATQAVTDAKNLVASPPGLSAQVAQANTQIKLAEQAVEQARAGVSDADTWHKYYPEGSLEKTVADQKLLAAQADLTAAQAQLSGAKTYLAALQKMRSFPAELVANLHAAQSQVQVAQAQVGLAQAALALAQTGATAEEIALARAQAQIAAAQVALVETQLTKFELTAPRAGVVTQKLVQVGEVARPGVPMLVISDLSRLTLKVYVPEAQIGRIGVGQTVTVRVDAYPDETFTGRVTRLGQQAEFTPSNVQTYAERTRLVFAVQITLADDTGRLKPGMPADVTMGP